MRLTAGQLNRATLARQLLLRRERLGVLDAVRRVVALQAQEPASPYLGLWNRLDRFAPAELDAAFAQRTVVRASLVRLTLHAVHASDYSAFHRAMLANLRASRLLDRRYTETGLSADDADAVLPDLVEFAVQPRTGAQLQAEVDRLLEARLGRQEPRMWWALRTFAPLQQVPTGGPWSFKVPYSYVAAGAGPDPSERDGVQHLLLRYLAAFGPASVADFAQFSMLRRPIVTQARQALADRVEHLEGPDGTVLLDLPEAPRPDGDAEPPPRLLPMWDSVLLAYADRSRVIPADYRSLVIRRNGDVLPTLLVDGHVAGVWRPVEGGIEATVFHRLDRAAWQGLATEAAALLAFLAERQPTVYGRFAHWWRKGLPGAEVRLLPE